MYCNITWSRFFISLVIFMITCPVPTQEFNVNINVAVLCIRGRKFIFVFQIIHAWPEYKGYHMLNWYMILIQVISIVLWWCHGGRFEHMTSRARDLHCIQGSEIHCDCDSNALTQSFFSCQRIFKNQSLHCNIHNLNRG